MNRKQRREYVKRLNTPQKLEGAVRYSEKMIRQELEKEYQGTLSKSLDLMFLAFVFTLHFNEKLQFGNKRINDVMQDVMATVNGLENEYDPNEYRQMLKDDGITYLERKYYGKVDEEC